MLFKQLKHLQVPHNFLKQTAHHYRNAAATKKSKCSRLKCLGCLVSSRMPFPDPPPPVLNFLLLPVPAEVLTHSLASLNSSTWLTFVDCKCHRRATAAAANTTSTLPAILALSRWSGAIIFPSCCGYWSFPPLLCKAKSRQNGLALRLSPGIHGRVIPAADEGDTLPARMESL